MVRHIFRFGKKLRSSCGLTRLRYTLDMDITGIIKEIIEAVIADKEATTKDDLQKIAYVVAAKYKLAEMPPLFRLLEQYRN